MLSVFQSSLMCKGSVLLLSIHNLENYFFKRLNSKYFRFCRLHGLCHHDSILPS